MKEMCTIVAKSPNLRDAPENRNCNEITKKSKTMCSKVMVKECAHKPLTIEETRDYFVTGKDIEECVPDKKSEIIISQSSTVDIVMPLVVPLQLYGQSSIVKEKNEDFSFVDCLPSGFTYTDKEFTTTSDGRLLYKGMEVMNCLVKIEQAIYSDKKTQYKCSIFIKGLIIEKTIPAKDFLNISWLQSKIPGFATNCEKGQASQLIYRYLNCLVNLYGLRNLCQKIKKPGWTLWSGCKIYVTPDGALPNRGQPIVSEYGQHFDSMGSIKTGDVHSFLRLAELTPFTWVAPVMLLYTVMSFSYALYKEAKLLPKFILFVNGPRGSFKTSIALAMTQIERSDNPEFSLKATAAGIEAGYKKYKDAVMLIDDLAPCSEIHERKLMQSNLEMIVRAYGDGSGKKRNYDFILKSDFDAEQYEAEGGAVITGEYVTGCESSLARCLLLPIKQDDVDVQLLSEVQENTKILPAFFMGYIDYLTQHYSEIVSYIQKKGKEYRENFVGKFSNARYGEYFAQLKIALELVLFKYGYETGQLVQSVAEQKYQYFMRCVCQAIEYNDKSLIGNAPVALLCKAITTKVSERMYPIVTKNVKIADTDHFILESDTAYFIRQEDIFAMKKSYDLSNGISGIEYTSRTLVTLLCDAGVASYKMEGKTKRTGIKIGKFRYVEINKQKLNTIANE